MSDSVVLNRIVKLMTVILSVGLLAGEARAGDPVKCNQYAQTAVTQGQQSVAKGCNFSGPRWQSSYQQHYQWCLAVPEEAANAETQARELDLTKCAEGGLKLLQPDTMQQLQPAPASPGEFTTTQKACSEYAKAAVAQNAENLKLGCGFSGGRWNSDYQKHYDWCLASGAQSAVETKARQAELAACHQQKACAAYAQRAVAQNAKNLADKCGLTGPAWNSNFNHHYDWCMAGQNVTNTVAQDKARDKQLALCGTNKPLDGTFKIRWVTPKLGSNGFVDEISASIEYASASVWGPGDYGNPQYGSIWAELTATNQVWESGLVKAKKSKTYVFSIRGIAGGTQSFLDLVPGNGFPAGVHNFSLGMKPAYPNLQLQGVREKFQVSGEDRCWYSYPRVDVKVFIVTTGNAVAVQSASTGNIENAPLTHVDRDDVGGFNEGVVSYDCR